MLTLTNKQIIKDEVVSKISGDRRSKRRYGLDLPVTYKIVKNCLVTGSGAGMTVDMSSGGIAFTSNETFKIGTHIELNVSWPVLLNGEGPMKLVIEGRVVRSDGPSTAIRMKRYEFRTQGRRVLFDDEVAPWQCKRDSHNVEHHLQPAVGLHNCCNSIARQEITSC